MRRVAPVCLALTILSLAACSSDETATPGDGADDAGASREGGASRNSSSGSSSGTGSSSGGSSSGDGAASVEDPYRQTVMTDAPVAYWRLGDPSGAPAKDEMGNAHPGAYYGTVEHAVPGIVAGNGAARFDGSTGCIGVGEYFRFPGRVAFSVEGWVHLTEYGAEGTRMVSTEGFPTGIRSGWNLSASYGDTGYPYFDAWSSEGTDNQYVMGAYSSTSPEQGKLPLGEWSYVVGTVDDEAEEIWVNGVLRNRVRQSTLDRANAGTLTIGCAGSGSGPIYLGARGALDEIAIYDKVLSPERIAAHYAAGRASR